MWAIAGWLMAEAARASWTKRRRRSSSPISSGEMTLRATGRLSVVSRSARAIRDGPREQQRHVVGGRAATEMIAHRGKNRVEQRPVPGFAAPSEREKPGEAELQGVGLRLDDAVGVEEQGLARVEAQ